MAENQTSEQRWQAATDRATKQFAETHRLHVRRDECNDQIIPGRRGHLYFDGEVLCLMAIDRAVANRSRWQALGGNPWLGDISPDAKGKRVQDVKISGVTAVKAAFRMAGIKPIRVLTPEQSANLERARAKISRNRPGSLFGTPEGS